MNNSFRYPIALLALLLAGLSVHAQKPEDTVLRWLAEHRNEGQWRAEQDEGWRITDRIEDRRGATFVHVQRTLAGLPVEGATAHFVVRNGAVVHVASRLEHYSRPERPVVSTGLVSADQAIVAALRAVGAEERAVQGPVGKGPQGQESYLLLGAKHDTVQVERVVYMSRHAGAVPAWSFILPRAKHWWAMRMDARSGEELARNDLFIRCSFDAPLAAPYNAMDHLERRGSGAGLRSDGAGYRAFHLPVESPAHGAHTLLHDPADAIASPYGWHDTDGADGPEYTITRGNNAYAYLDRHAQDEPGYSPDGGAELLFDFPFLSDRHPHDHADAAITNVFVTTNRIHDILYRYGFNEVNGNFQENNYGKGGIGGDPILVEAQDGGGANNANFATPPDGFSGVMQMFLWRKAADSTLTISAPASIAGAYRNVQAGFGPIVGAAAITAPIVAAEDRLAPTTDGCEDLVNVDALNGGIALVDRGQCNFSAKVSRLENAGARAVLVVNNTDEEPSIMGGGEEEVGIPSQMIAQSDGAAIRAALALGPVMATLYSDQEPIIRDPDYDNGIILHEIAHGVSSRLTGGPTNTGCLFNEDQMGEGWSDYISMLLTWRAGEGPEHPRPVGTYAQAAPVTGRGIRPAPYSPDMDVNPYTYGHTNQSAITEPHGIGFIWATMLWDMTWALVAEHGLGSPAEGTGGMGLALSLVMDGIRLQPCRPGSVDGRDAILRADTLFHEAANSCIIWEAFARRGLGVGASQGDSDHRFDQVEDFEVPVSCRSSNVGRNEQAAGALRLVPNPASGLVRVEYKATQVEQVSLRLLTADGRVVRDERGNTGDALYLTLDGLAPGMYVVQLLTSNSSLQERLIVE